MALKILAQAVLTPTSPADTALFTVPTGQEVVVSTVVIQGLATADPTDGEVRVLLRPNGDTLADQHNVLVAPRGTVVYNGRISVTEGWALPAGTRVSATVTGDAAYKVAVTIFGDQSPVAT